MQDELYQAGHQPFTEMHAVRSMYRLQSWIALVERGGGRIGTEGMRWRSGGMQIHVVVGKILHYS